MNESPTGSAPSSPSEGTPASEYVLGTGDDELQRLGLQHRLWADIAHALFRRAQIGPGRRVLDVGCGPGYATLDLAELVAHRGAAGAAVGTVTGVDESPGFVAHLTAQARSRGLRNVLAKEGDVQRLREVLPDGSATFDAAYARWVLCFVPDPEAVVAGVAELLKPRGSFLVHDYFNYRAMTMVPRRKSHDRAVEATMASWRGRGGDPDVAGRLPRLLLKHGLEVVHLEVHQRIARPEDSMFHWPATWWRSYTPKLVGMGYLTQAECDEMLADLDEVEASEADFIQLPPVTEIMARRR